MARLLVRIECLGLASDPVQGGHQQRPQTFAEGIGRGELGQWANGCGRVGLESAFEVDLHRGQPLLHQPVHHRGEAMPSEPGQRRPGPFGQCRLDVAQVQLLPEARHVDRLRVDNQAVRRTDPDDGAGAEAFAETDHIRLQRLLGRARRLLTPHQVDQTRHRNGRTGREHQHREHRLTLRRAHVHRLLTVGGADATQETDPDHGVLPPLRTTFSPIIPCTPAMSRICTPAVRLPILVPGDLR